MIDGGTYTSNGKNGCPAIYADRPYSVNMGFLRISTPLQITSETNEKASASNVRKRPSLCFWKKSLDKRKAAEAAFIGYTVLIPAIFLKSDSLTPACSAASATESSFFLTSSASVLQIPSFLALSSCVS